MRRAGGAHPCCQKLCALRAACGLRANAVTKRQRSARVNMRGRRRKVGGTDGNLSVHLRKLEEADYVEVEKGFRGRRPHTTVRLTKKGREAWIAYIARMEDLLRPKAAE